MIARVMLAIVVAGVVTFGSTTAQNNEASPDRQAPADSLSASTIDDVDGLLAWARKEIGCGFIFDPTHITGKDGESLKIAFMPPAASKTGQPADRIVSLFECLRSLGLVAMEIRGLEPATYHILPVHEAASYVDVVNDVAQLDGLYFGTLALEARTISVEALETLIRKYTGKHAEISTFKETSVVVVSDFVDGLWAAATACDEAQIPAERDDDTVSEFFATKRHEASSVMYALLDARMEGEQYEVTLHDASQSLLITGKRRDVYAALDRAELLEAAESAPEQTVGLYVLDLRSLPVVEAHKALEAFFAEDIRRLQVRLTPVPLKGQIVIECPASRLVSAKNLLAEIDPMQGLLTPEQPGR